MYFWKCMLYIAILGILCFPIGRLLALITFDPLAFPFKLTKLETEGRFYEKIRIQKWKEIIPDISRSFSKIVPRKRVNRSEISSHQFEMMVNETCVAEVVHYLLDLLGIALFFLWPGLGGVIFYIAYFLFGNLEFILVQRYNRPRLYHIYQAMLRKEQRKAETEQKVQQSVSTAN